MRSLILALGSRGDVEPLIALAARLVDEGHEATVCAPSSYASDVAFVGAQLVPMGDTADRLMRSAMGGMHGPREAFKLMRPMAAALRAALDEQWAAAGVARPDIVVGHPKALGGIHIAERLAVPYVAAMTVPLLTPTSAFPIPVITRLPRSLNRVSYQANRLSAAGYGGLVNAFRRDVLGLPGSSRLDDYLHHADGTRVPVLYGFSRYVVPVPEDYPDEARVTGYWFRPERPWTAPPGLAEFLAAGHPVVSIGFGSMGFGKDAAARGAMIREAVDRAGVRAVVATGWGGLELDDCDRVRVVDAVPHDWLFARVDAVVHHGGSGTTAAGLRAGRPTLVCPVLGDQPFWGRRIHRLGAGPAPIPLADLDAGRLAAALTELVGTPRFAARAGLLAGLIQTEDGTGSAVHFLERVGASLAPW